MSCPCAFCPSTHETLADPCGHQAVRFSQSRVKAALPNTRSFALPTRIGQHGSDQLHSMLTLTDDVFGAPVAGIDQMPLGQQQAFR